MDDVKLTQLICFILGTIPGWDWSSADPGTVKTISDEFTDTYFDELPYSLGDHVSDPADVVIFYGALGASPDRAVGVRVYGTTDEPDLRWRRVQIRFRGERGRPDGADALATPAFEALHGLSRLAGISGISRQSMSPAGADDNRREERTENYLVLLDNDEALT